MDEGRLDLLASQVSPGKDLGKAKWASLKYPREIEYLKNGTYL